MINNNLDFTSLVQVSLYSLTALSAAYEGDLFPVRLSFIMSTTTSTMKALV